MTHICFSELTIIGSDNGLSPDRRQAIIWTSAGILSIGPSGTNFSEILIEILPFSSKKMRLKVSSAKWRPFRLGLNVLIRKAFPCQDAITSRWRHNERDGVSNHRRLNGLFNRLFRRRSKKTPKLRITGLCEGNSPVTGEFPSHTASHAENVSIRWRHHV